MANDRFITLFAAAVLTAVLIIGCHGTAPPDVPAVPSGPTSSGVAVMCEYSSTAVDPGGDNTTIRFDWDDGDTSDWCAYMVSGDTATAVHAWSDTGTYHVRAQAKNMANVLSDWSAELQVVVVPGWTRTYGGPDLDDGRAVGQTTDGGYIIAGCTKSFGEGEVDAYLVRTTAAGDTVWTRTVGGVGAGYAEDVQPTADGGCIWVGEFDLGNRQIWLFKMDEHGNRQWDRLYGFSGAQELGSSVQPTSDGGYIIAGKTQDHGHDDAFLVKTDAQGNTQWYADKGYDDYSDWATDIRQTTDGGYIFTGTTYRHDDDGDVWLVKVDAGGGTAWFTYFPGTDAAHGEAVQQTADGGYIIGCTVGPAGSQDVCLVKTDGNGGYQWAKSYGGAAADFCGFVQQTTDGGYIVGGSTMSAGAGQTDIYLVKTDAQGNVLWEKTFGGSAYDWGGSARQTADGGYVLVGATESYGVGSYDVYLVKTDKDGNCLP
jgi:hypothetical protein